MWIVITAISVSVVIVAIVAILELRKRRYRRFLLKNSICLERLNKLNERYAFYPQVDLNQSHTYDNQVFYDDISCRDYLIYQLQYFQNQVCDQIEKIDRNRVLYAEYGKEIERIRMFGQYHAAPGKLKLSALQKQEKWLFYKQILPAPCRKFALSVTLYCSKINGQVYRKKSAVFVAEDVLTLVKRLRQRNGKFYTDRAIWDALCRVERGKVSNKMRFSIYARDHYRCRNCGVSDRFAQLEIDHIIPIAKGGKTTYDNLQTLCHRCNVAKGDKLLS